MSLIKKCFCSRLYGSLMLASSQLFYEEAISIIYHLISLQKLAPNMSKGWTCLRTGLVLTCLGAGHVSGPEMSQGRRCLRASFVSRFVAGDVQGRKCLATGSVPNFRAGSVSRPEVSQSLGPEVPRGRTWFTAGSVLELDFQSDASCECCNLNGIRANKSSMPRKRGFAGGILVLAGWRELYVLIG
jgi:hypothetical protein